MGKLVRQTCLYICACLHPEGRDPTLFSGFIGGLRSTRAEIISRFTWNQVAFRLSHHWDFRPPRKSCWLDSSCIGIGLSTCCHHHNLPLWIIMAEKQGSLWASTPLLCRTAFLLFFLGWTRKDARSKHAEPGCCDGLHWDLWGIGGHGDGLLCLLVSFSKCFFVKPGQPHTILAEPKRKDKQGGFSFERDNDNMRLYFMYFLFKVNMGCK